MKLTISEPFDGWYVIERAEHDGHTGLRRADDGMLQFWSSARISDASVEGPAEDMHGIASAIETRGSFSARRCAVRFADGGFRFESPRNSTRESDPVPVEDADALAVLIRAAVGGAGGER